MDLAGLHLSVVSWDKYKTHSPSHGIPQDIHE